MGVIWCTGYTGDFSWIEPGLLDEYGQPRRDRPAAIGAPGLFCIVLRWLTMRGGCSRPLVRWVALSRLGR